DPQGRFADPVSPHGRTPPKAPSPRVGRPPSPRVKVERRSSSGRLATHDDYRNMPNLEDEVAPVEYSPEQLEAIRLNLPARGARLAERTAGRAARRDAKGAEEQRAAEFERQRKSEERRQASQERRRATQAAVDRSARDEQERRRAS